MLGVPGVRVMLIGEVEGFELGDGIFDDNAACPNGQRLCATLFSCESDLIINILSSKATQKLPMKRSR